jgi:hypothetical protein
MPPGASPGAAGADPGVAASARLLRRRQRWSRAAGTLVVLGLLGFAAGHEASSSGTPPPLWYDLVIAGFGALGLACAAVAVILSVRLRRGPQETRASADKVFAEQQARQSARHYPRWNALFQVVLWAGMLMIVAVAVVSVPAVVNGVAYLAGAEKTVTFDPVSHETVCHTRGGCEVVTEGVMETGGQGTEASWPHEVPLGKPFPIRQPFWQWGLGAALIDSAAIAVVAILVSLLIQAFAVFLVVRLISRVRRRWRHRREVAAMASAPAARPMS